jgi:dipeptidyl aminopeptidase/acylaminoacyl peptidase
MFTHEITLFYFMFVLSFTSCMDQSKTIGKKNIEISNGRLTPEILWSMGRVSGIQMSPDAKQVLYSVEYYDLEQNKGNTDVYRMSVEGGGSEKITKSTESELCAKWSADGHLIYYLYQGQLWKMRPDGKKKKQISTLSTSIEDFLLSPDGHKVLFITTVPISQKVVDQYPDLKKASGVIVDDLMYKHWDEWVKSVPHPHIADLNDKGLDNIVDILEGQPYESPMRPFGGIEQFSWSPDGQMLAYTCRKKTGMEYALSTNSDIFLYDLAGKTTKNITLGMEGYDTNPKFSPDGKMIAFQSMQRDGYESDLDRLFVYDLETEQNTFVSQSLDGDVHHICWASDNQTLFFLSALQAVTQVFEIQIDGGNLKQITNEQCDYEQLLNAGDRLLTLKHSLSRPNEVFLLDPKNGASVPLTDENKDIFSQLNLGEVEKRMIPSTDGKHILTWVVYPPGFDKTKQYPAILFCTGGPQGTLGQFWSYRWNAQLMAAQGYIVVIPNRRGVSGMGQQWKEEISGHYGTQEMQDLFSAIDAVSNEPYVDADRLACAGASFGGFTVYWMAGNHQKRFKAFIAHSGIFNLDAQYVETDEMWFENWDMGGPFWEKSNAISQKSFKQSPHLFVDKWDTPILCIHGEKDYRILASQSMQAFNAAKLRGIPAQLLVYPDENHWISTPQNSILWQRTFFAWLDKWLK